MARIDFSRADLRSVEFRNLNLDEVYFPTDENHIVLNEYTRTLDSALQSLRSRDDAAFRSLTAYLEVYRKWAGPNQQRGVLNKIDLVEIGGEDGLEVVLASTKG